MEGTTEVYKSLFGNHLSTPIIIKSNKKINGFVAGWWYNLKVTLNKILDDNRGSGNFTLKKIAGTTFIKWTKLNCVWCVCALSYVQLLATPWTTAHQAPLSMEFSGQECWSGLPFPSQGSSRSVNGTPISCVSCVSFFIAVHPGLLS